VCWVCGMCSGSILMENIILNQYFVFAIALNVVRSHVFVHASVHTPCFLKSSTVSIPTPSCNDYAAFIAAYAELCRDAPYQKCLDKEMQLAQKQDQNMSNSSSDPKRKQAATGTLVEETQRELQGQKHTSAIKFDSKSSAFISSVPLLSSSTSDAMTLPAKTSLLTDQAAAAAAIVKGDGSSSFGSSRCSALYSSFSSSSLSFAQQQRTSSQPRRSATSLASLLGGYSFLSGAPASSVSERVSDSSDTKALSSSLSSASSSSSSMSTPGLLVERMADL
jgi:hypothetical protein